MNGRYRRATLLGWCLLCFGSSPTFGSEDAESLIEGKIFDAAGNPVAECRVVARTAEGVEVFLSPPSDADGGYSVAVPTGRDYQIVALVAPNGARIGLQPPRSVEATGARVQRDLHLPDSARPRSRRGANRPGGGHRLFLSFVEDPALVGRQYWELQLQAARDNDLADLTAGRFVAAFNHWELPRIEFGLRGGYGEIGPPGRGAESGALDLELWAKFLLLESPEGRWGVALGALMTLPVGDEDAGLGRNATQAEWFVAASRVFGPAALVGHLGAATSEDGEVAGRPLDGEVTASAGLGLLVQLSDEASMVFEADYEGARFAESDSRSRLLAGFNWQVHWRGRLRVAVAGGLADASSDVELTTSYAFAF